ncbi:MAG: HAD family hydrolase [Planctomycetes bacterium]|nr:HAD family hydrolase [Planctomycetota bacterium]
MTIKTIVLDFDGVIVESEEIKNQAFRDLFSNYPQYVDQIMSYHLAHKTTSRYEKFEYIVTQILGEVYDKARASAIDSRFSPFIRQRIIECPYVPGAKDFLDYFSSTVPLYLVSATPQEELGIIIESRTIDRRFKGVYGNPWQKTDAIDEIMREEKVAPEAVVYIGDTMDDYRVAEQLGLLFVGRVNKQSFDNIDIIAYDDLIEMKSYLQQMIESNLP